MAFLLVFCDLKMVFSGSASSILFISSAMVSSARAILPILDVLFVYINSICCNLRRCTFSLLALRTRSLTSSNSALFFRLTCSSSCSRILRYIVFLPYFFRFSAMILSMREELAADTTLDLLWPAP